ncbi:MAG TPA: hypothetical protein VI894_00580 [Candidatus Nanoarchaeia archaeon]|nr:hypothetical protein [Candidatus Nanoarchaeia archaeon]
MMMELRSRRERPLATLVDKIVLWNFDLKDAMHILWARGLWLTLRATTKKKCFPQL